MHLRVIVPKAIVILMCSSAFAQTPSPTPSSQGNYGLYFSIAASELLVSGDPTSNTSPLNLSASQQFTSDGCNVTFQTDGSITCFVNSSCSADSNTLPFCAFTFSAPAGLTIDEVATLSPVSDSTSETSASSRSELAPLPNGHSATALYKASKKIAHR